METYYTKKEYNEMKNALTRKLKAAEKKIALLQKKLGEESVQSLDTHVTEEPHSSED